MVTDGWHHIKGYLVLVQDGKVIRGTNSFEYTLYPYKRVAPNSWRNVSGIVSFATLRSGLYRGSYRMA